MASSVRRKARWIPEGWLQITRSSLIQMIAKNSMSAWMAWRRANRVAATVLFTTRSNKDATRLKMFPAGELDEWHCLYFTAIEMKRCSWKNGEKRIISFLLQWGLVQGRRQETMKGLRHLHNVPHRDPDIILKSYHPRLVCNYVCVRYLNARK